MKRMDYINNYFMYKLSKLDKEQIKLSIQYGFPPIETNKNGQIKLKQWKSWKNLQRLSLGYIKEDGDNYRFELSESGKNLAKSL